MSILAFKAKTLKTSACEIMVEPKQTETDAQLVVRVQRGDKQAFNVLVLKYQHKIMSVVSRFIQDHSEIQDVTQEAFIKAYSAMHNFRGDSAFYTWVYRIAINTAKNHIVSNKRRVQGWECQDVHEPVTQIHEQLHSLETPESNMACAEIEHAIQHSLEKLPDELRTAIKLREFNGLSYDEIADIMQCPVGTVRSRIFRAREAIDAILKPLIGE